MLYIMSWMFKRRENGKPSRGGKKRIEFWLHLQKHGGEMLPTRDWKPKVLYYIAGTLTIKCRIKCDYLVKLTNDMCFMNTEGVSYFETIEATWTWKKISNDLIIMIRLYIIMRSFRARYRYKDYNIL